MTESGAPLGTLQDAELLAAVRSGDKGALEQLLEKHQAQVYRFGMKMCRDPEDAREILQDTLLALARGATDFREASSLSTWLYTVARSFCIKKRRRRKSAPQETSLEASPEADRVADQSRGPDEVLSGKQVEAALDRAIHQLEPDQREVLVLRDVEGLTAPEVAHVLGISAQAVKSRLHRARLAVRESVAPLLDLPPEGLAPTGACPDVLTLLSKHLENEIGPDVCAEMERHLEGCPRCRASCASLKQTLSLCQTAGSEANVPPGVKSAVQTALKDFLHSAP